jgi:hypothetical protein
MKFVLAGLVATALFVSPAEATTKVVVIHVVSGKRVKIDNGPPLDAAAFDKALTAMEHNKSVVTGYRMQIDKGATRDDAASAIAVMARQPGVVKIGFIGLEKP